MLNTDTYLDEVRKKGLLASVPTIRHPTDRHMIDPARVAILDSLVQKTGAFIVISSSWRNFYNPGEMAEFLKLQGSTVAHERIIGQTPRRFSWCPRGYLIGEWLGDHRECTAHVALDDDDGAAEGGIKLVLTDPFEGLTEERAEKAARILDAG